MSRLSNLSCPGGSYLFDDGAKVNVFHVDRPSALVQATGYIKYVLAQEEVSQVFYRGQGRLYPTLRPSLYRGITTEGRKLSRDSALKKYLSSAKTSCLRTVPEYAHEPLLQHYGIRTRWIDVVDNVWVALWFACHEATSVGRYSEYLHFDRRAARTDSDYAYILLLKADAGDVDPKCPGFLSGSLTNMIDLRVACPSNYLRPHAQHGLLIRRSKGLDYSGVDYSDFIAGIIRVRLSDAIAWLGDGTLLSVRSLFPPATFDEGYRILLGNAPAGNDSVGSIHIVGP